jgi:hypothetical protein
MPPRRFDGTPSRRRTWPPASSRRFYGAGRPLRLTVKDRLENIKKISPSKASYATRKDYFMACRVQQLIDLAQAVAENHPDFFAIKGAGAGDRDTNEFMASLRDRAQAALGHDLAEQQICGDNGLCVDFYFQEEETIVEVALGLRNPLSEFERDILKAILSKVEGFPVRRLLFLSKPGATKRCSQPGARAIKDWAESTQGVKIEIQELRVDRVVRPAPALPSD